MDGPDTRAQRAGSAGEGKPPAAGHRPNASSLLVPGEEHSGDEFTEDPRIRPWRRDQAPVKSKQRPQRPWSEGTG